MSLEHILSAFHAWAPTESPWSSWAKPILFKHQSQPALPPIPLPLDALPHGDKATAFVVDLPGITGLRCAMTLAYRGHRPVPMYNVTFGPRKNIYDASTIAQGLYSAVESIRSANIPQDASPAFLIDCDRMIGMPNEGDYDNRWLVFPQDLPSGKRLKEGGVSRVIVIRADRPILHDLRAILRNWKRDGLEIQFFDAVHGTLSEPTVELSIFATFGDHLNLVFHGLRTNSSGGFGGVVPEASSGSG